MKIFLSHSGTQNHLVDELNKQFPEHIKTWIDENNLLVGEKIEENIKHAINVESDYLIIFIEKYSSESPWIKKELEWALNHENEINRQFLIPVVLDKESLKSENFKELIERKYIPFDIREYDVKKLADDLTSKLCALLSKNLFRSGRIANEDILYKAENIENELHNIALEIIKIVHPHRRYNALLRMDLYKELKKYRLLSDQSYDEINRIFQLVRNHRYLPGIIIDGQFIFIDEEHIAWKINLCKDEKKKIAQKAISYIKKDFTIALDAGSTTSEVSRQISEELKNYTWDKLKIVTNSIPAANELLTTASQMGLDDSTSLLKVYMVSGRIRPNTEAIVTDEEFSIKNNFKSILSALGGADICFVGTNGIHKDFGFTT